MAAYNTIPESADQLKKPKTSMKLVAGVAAAAFVLGVIAATAVTTERTHSTKDGPAVAPFEPEDSYCPVGQTCDVACAKGYAGFDAAMNCKNANVGYCCK